MVSRGSLRKPLPDPQAELDEARREVGDAEARLARQEARPGGPHPNTVGWLGRARRRLEAAEGQASGGRVDPGAWTRAELRRLAEAYGRALSGVDGDAIGGPPALARTIVERFPGRLELSVAHHLGYISAILEEEGLTPLPSIPPRPGYPDALRAVVMAEVVAPRVQTQSKYDALTRWLARSSSSRGA